MVYEKRNIGWTALLATNANEKNFCGSVCDEETNNINSENRIIGVRNRKGKLFRN